MSMDEMNNKFYNMYADSFDKIPFDSVLPPLILRHLPAPSCKILEIGSGAGALARWLSKLGHHVTCLEPAEKPAQKSKEKGLNVCVMRFQDFPVNETFDHIIAISSLIHIPKSELPAQLQKMTHLLKQDGLALVSFIEGESKGEEDPTEKGMNRFFSKFKESELIAMLSSHFSILEMIQIEVKKMNQTFFLMALKRL